MEITGTPIMKYYDSSKPLTLQKAANLMGLCAFLLQNGQPIDFSSKSFQPHQKAHVATELESLALALAMEKFHHFLFIKRFHLETDQKPFEMFLPRV